MAVFFFGFLFCFITFVAYYTNIQFWSIFGIQFYYWTAGEMHINQWHGKEWHKKQCKNYIDLFFVSSFLTFGTRIYSACAHMTRSHNRWSKFNQSMPTFTQQTDFIGMKFACNHSRARIFSGNERPSSMWKCRLNTSQRTNTFWNQF